MNKLIFVCLFCCLLSTLTYANNEFRQSNAKKEQQQSATRVVTGKVTDEFGVALPGVSIFVPGTALGTTTDIDGSFSLKVPANTAILEVSYIGMKDREIVLNATENYVLKMEPDAIGLDEVVAIGYGSTKKEDLSMAVSTMRVDESIKSRSSDNIANIMQGEIPGVTVQLNSGDPMSSSPNSINIRGRGSSNSDEVLFVVDGVPNAPFNVQDVEAITVLKDAASSSIYGSAVGSGGVVVITTRKAKAGKLAVNTNISTGFKKVNNLPALLTAEEFNQVNKDAFEYAGKPLPDIFNPSLYPYGNVTRTDWLSEIFQVANTQRYALSLSGGNEKLQGLLSASYNKEEGVMLNTFSEKLDVKAELNFKLTDWLRINQRGVFEHKNGQGNVPAYGHESVLMSAILFPRSATIYEYDKDGNQIFDDFNNPVFGGTIPAYLAEQGMNGYGEVRNPVATLLRLRQNRPENRIYSTTTLELKPLTDLTIKSNFSADLKMSRFENFSPRILEIGRPDASNSRRIFNDYNFSWLWETIANYSKRFNGKHYVSAMLAYTMKHENYRYNDFTVFDFDREDEHYTIWGNGNDYSKVRPNEEIWDESMFSALGRISYTYDNKYFFTGSVRRDASSKLWKENNYGYFPAFSTAWKVSSEPFFDNYKNTVNLLKLRGSWGVVGNNQPLPLYPFNIPLKQAGYQNFYGKDLQTEAIGIYMATVVNKDLKWERTEQTGFGLDLGLYNNTFEFSVDYFDKTTKDLIERIPLSQTIGKPVEPWGNVGEVSNKGWEFSLKYNKAINKIKFSLFANLSTVKNEVLDLGNRKEFIHTGQHVNNVINPLYSKEGEPWYSFYLIETEGVFQSKKEIDEYIYKNPKTGNTQKIQPNARPGDFKFKDFNNDGEINDDDRQFMGSYLPEMTYGFGGNVSFSGFDLSVFFQGVSGVKIFNGWKQMGLSGRGGNTGYNFTSDILKSWNYDKSSGYPSFGFVQKEIAGGLAPQDNLSAPSDFFLEDGDYLKLRNITLGYTLPKSIMNRLNIPDASLRFYVSGENLLTFTDYSGITPEVGNYGVDTGTYPTSSMWNFGLSFDF